LRNDIKLPDDIVIRELEGGESNGGNQDQTT